MIEYIKVINDGGSELMLPLNDWSESGMLITNIEGIGTVRASINMSSYVDNDFKKNNSNILETRNIVFSFLYTNTENESIEQVRDKSYSFFTPKKKIHLVFKTTNRFVGIDGYVESNDPTIFAEAESAQVSILCEDPLFYDESTKETIRDDYDFNAIEAKLEFPVENPSLTEKLIEFGEVTHKPTNAIDYEGEYDIGLTINIHCTGMVTDPIIYSSRQGGYFKLLTDKLTEVIPGSTKFLAGDVIIVNTISGSKSIRLLRNGKVYNILHIIAAESIWPILKNGLNEFTVDSLTGFEFIKISYSYDTGFLGI